MVATNSFRQQHDGLVEIVTEISGYLDGTNARDNAKTVSSLLNQLSGRLNIHLRMEDTVIYPKMIESSNAEASKTARQFQDEMGGLSKAYMDYAGKWNVPQNIETDPDGFITDTKAVFAALATRIERENNDLYPLAEQV